MAQEDDADYRRRIVDVLEAHGFGWVVAQAEAQIAEGKPASKQVSEPEILRVSEDTGFAIRHARKRRASLITTEPYSEAERLDILLHAIEAALVQRSELERAALGEVHGVDTIRFEPEGLTEGLEGSYRGRPHDLNASRAATGIEIGRDATAVLARIKHRART